MAASPTAFLGVSRLPKNVPRPWRSSVRGILRQHGLFTGPGLSVGIRDQLYADILTESNRLGLFCYCVSACAIKEAKLCYSDKRSK